MADSILTALSGFSDINDSDYIYVVDVSDDTDNDAGTGKKITRTNFLASASLSSPTLDEAVASTSFDLNGVELILDADGDTSLTADTDDQIDILISDADDFQFTANTFTALSGSSIETDTISETTGAHGVAIDGLTIKDAGFALGSDANGDIYYRSGGALARLAKGFAYQILQMNSGATAPEWTNNNTYNVKTYGATGDGETDDAEAIQDAIDAANDVDGGIVFFPEGTYVVGSELTMYSNIYIKGVPGSTVIDYSAIDSSFDVFSTEGTEEDAIDLSANASIGDTTLTLTDTSSLSAGDYIKLRDDANNLDNNVLRGEICRIDSVDSETEVTLKDLVISAYTTANNAAVVKLNFIENVIFEGIHILGPEESAQTSRGIYLHVVKGFTIRNCKFERCQHSGIYAEVCLYGYVDNCDFLDGEGDEGTRGYGFVAAVCSQDLIMTNCFGHNLKHLFTAGGAGTEYGLVRRVTVANCKADEMRYAALDTHANGMEVSYIGNIVRNSVRAGLRHRGKSGAIIGNIITDCGDEGIAVTPFSTELGGYVITGNYVSRVAGDGIFYSESNASYGDSEYLSITGNTIHAAAGGGVFVSSNGANALENVVVSGNSINAALLRGIYLNNVSNGSVIGNAMTVDGDSAFGIEVSDDEAGVNKTSITGNSIILSSSTGTIGIDVDDGDDNIISSNIISGAANAIKLDNNCTYNNVQSNNVRNCTAGITLGTGDGNAQANNIT